MSADFDAFLNSNFFGNPFNAWHDGLDVPVLTRLQGTELAEAEAILLKNLPDSRAVVGLGEIRSQKAVEPLRKLLRQQQAATESAVALFKINGETAGLTHLINMLTNLQNFWSQRMEAAIALSHFRSQHAVHALLTALDDPEKLVRHHAAKSLLSLYTPYAEAILRDNPQIVIKIMQEGERDAAVAALKQMVQEHSLNHT